MYRSMARETSDGEPAQTATKSSDSSGKTRLPGNSKAEKSPIINQAETYHLPFYHLNEVPSLIIIGGFG